MAFRISIKMDAGPLGREKSSDRFLMSNIFRSIDHKCLNMNRVVWMDQGEGRWSIGFHSNWTYKLDSFLFSSYIEYFRKFVCLSDSQLYPLYFFSVRKVSSYILNPENYDYFLPSLCILNPQVSFSWYHNFNNLFSGRKIRISW